MYPTEIYKNTFNNVQSGYENILLPILDDKMKPILRFGFTPLKI